MFFEIESLGFAFSRMLTINLSTPPHLLSDVANMLVLFIESPDPHLIFDYVHMEFII